MKKNMILASVAVLAFSFAGAANAVDLTQKAKLDKSIVVTGGYIGAASNINSKDSVNAIQTNGLSNSIALEQQGGKAFKVPTPTAKQIVQVKSSVVATLGIIGNASNNASNGSANIIGTTGGGNSYTVKFTK